MSLLAVDWHFWVAPYAIGISIITIIGLTVYYLNSVTGKRYPRD